MARTAWFCLACLACTLFPLSVYAYQLKPTVASGWGGDDWNISSLDPLIAGSAPVGNFFTTILGNNSFNSETGWIFQFANAPFLQNDITIDTYYAWVVNSPNVVGPLPGGPYNVNKHGSVGGAVFAMTYSQNHPNDPDPETIHFIQIYRENLNGAPPQVFCG